MDSLAFAVGELATYVQAPKAKGRRNRTLFGFPTPRSRVLRAVCGGAPQTFSLRPQRGVVFEPLHDELRTAILVILAEQRPGVVMHSNPCGSHSAPYPYILCAVSGLRGNVSMSEVAQLRFHSDAEGRLRLPEQCSVAACCYETEEARQAVTAAMEQILYALALFGFDLRALDGITMTQDCRATGISLQSIPEGQVPLEMSDQPDTMEMARTVAVWREEKLRFHIVFRAGIGLMALSPEKNLQALAHACIAHEAAHVEHEGHLYRIFPGIYGRQLECGERSRQTFLKAMDVWSEYAACRSSAAFRPEALEEFEGIFCRALEESLTASTARIEAFRRERNATDVFVGIQQVFGDVFIHAGYFLGHLDGLERTLASDAPTLSELFQKYPELHSLIVRLRRVLHELWLSEYAWQSIDVFAPIYDLICEMMALHGLAFAKHEKEWRIVLCEDEHATAAIQSALAAWLARPDESKG
jgi:hypothetical protein